MKRKGKPKALLGGASPRVEAIEWDDAFSGDREHLDVAPMLLLTVGFAVYEDKKFVVLASELESRLDYSERVMRYTAIPKKMILKRTAFGTYTIGEKVTAGGGKPANEEGTIPSYPSAGSVANPAPSGKSISAGAGDGRSGDTYPGMGAAAAGG